MSLLFPFQCKRVPRSYNIVISQYTSLSTVPTSRISHNLICDCIYNVKISVLVLNNNSNREHCFVKMDMYTFQEVADMLLIYGCAHGNDRGAGCLYQQSFLQQHLPHRQTRNGTFQLVTTNWGRPLSIQTPNLEDDILHHTEQNPARSARSGTAVEHVSHMTIWRVLRQLLYPVPLVDRSGSQSSWLFWQESPSVSGFFSSVCWTLSLFLHCCLQMKQPSPGMENWIFTTITCGQRKILWTRLI
jgi:hypothetical protein